MFSDVESATKAIEEVQGFEIFGKEMSLEFARNRSDAFVKRTGGDEELESHKRRRLAEKGRQQLLSIPRTRSGYHTDFDGTDKKKAVELAEQQKLIKRQAAAAGVAPDPGARPIKAARGTGLKSTNASAAAVIPDEYLPPNKTLFVQNLPEEYDIEGLTAIFGRYEGFREVRLVPGRRGIAFVEYDNETGAISAKENTAGMTLGAAGLVIKVTYQRQ